MNWVLFKNSLMVSALSTLGALGAGFAAALWLAMAPRRAQRWGLAATAAMLALPSFLITGCWLRLLGQTGVWRSWLPWNIYSLSGTVWILALTLWPLAALVVFAGWQKLEPGWLDSDPALRGTSLLRWVLLPVARDALAQAATITFVLALNNFAIPALLQVKVYPAEMWVGFNTTFNYAEAMKLSWPLIAAPLLLLLVLRRHPLSWPRWDGGLRAGALKRQLGGGWYWGSGILFAGLICFGMALPMLELVLSKSTWHDLVPAFAAGSTAFMNSAFFAAGTATLCVAAGLGLHGKFPAWVAWMPFLAPGIVLGVALVWVVNRSPLHWLGQSAGVVFAAWFLRYFAPALAGAGAARRSVDGELTDMARLEGAGRWARFRLVHWPQMAAPLAAVWYIIYLLCLWDVETLLLVVPPGGETLSLRIFNLLHYGHNAQVNALCLWLLGLAVLPPMLWLAWHRWRAGRAFCLVAATGLAAGCGPNSSLTEAPLKSELFSRAQTIGCRGTGLGQFNKPRSVAVDGADNLYVVDMTARVQKFDSNGVFAGSWQMEQTEKGKPKGMDSDANGNIIVIEPHYTRINIVTPDLKPIRRWGDPGTNGGQLAFPRSVAVNTRGELIITEHSTMERVQRFTAEGRQWLGAFGRAGSGPGEFSRAEGVGTDAQDRIYVADSCNHRIQVFSRDGAFISMYGVAGKGAGELSYPYDIRVDDAGRQYVCEFGNSRIQVFDAHGKSLEILGRQGSNPGEFFNPWSLALDSRGNLYVADTNNHRVQKLVRRKPENNRREFKIASAVSGSSAAPVAAGERAGHGEGAR